jgi:mannitol/fructose-specific phosphotransferase system IIA component (Ntr-type)
MRLAYFFRVETVICPLKGQTRSAVIEELLSALGRVKQLRDRKAAALAIEEREKLGSTAIGNGVALPHARTGGVDGLAVALGTSQKGVDFGAPDREPVKIVVLILAPGNESALYLSVLSAVSQLLKGDETRRRLLDATSAKEILQIIENSGIKVEEKLKVKDIMSPVHAVVTSKTSLKEVVDLLLKHQALELPVVDEKGKLIGEIFIDDVLKAGLPEYLFRMGSASFLSGFEPFERLLEREAIVSVGDVMSEAVGVVDCNASFVQAALLLVQHDIRSLIVVEGEKPVGIISLSDFIRKILRP